ncbi:MAG: beta-propeller domain-containing protein [Candidatus Bathyarchaeota archaeon]
MEKRVVKGRKWILFGLMAMLVVGVLISSFSVVYWFPEKAYASSLKSFESYDMLEEFVKAKLEEANRTPQVYTFVEGLVYSVTGAKIFSISRSLTSPSALVVSEAPEYSTTNIQVVGVDEADIVKTDGEYIYLVSKDKVYIVKAYPPGEMRVVSEIMVNGTSIGLFINKDRLVILKYEEFLSTEQPYQENLKGIIMPTPWFYGISVEVYDLSSINNPTLARKVSLNGGYVGSRMIGNYVYAVVSQPLIRPLNENFGVFYPSIAVNGIVKNISPTKIYYSNETIVPSSYTVIVAINIFKDGETPECKAILTGYASCIYVSLDNIYVAMPKWGGRSDLTEIHRISINGSKITCEASGEVPGKVLNQFSMDEYKGYFRIATTTGSVTRFLGQAATSNNVYVLDVENLKIVGKLEDLAPGEKIYSARFMGDRCYIVTFKKVDPLFTIDLTNPNEPKVLGKLKIPGYSDYLHPYDENHLIGVGKETVPAEEGDFAWYQGVKISLFDVSDVTNPKEVGKVVIGDRGTETPVLQDHHAFLFNQKRNLMVIPILEAKIFPEKYAEKIPPWTYGEYVFQGAYVFHISPEDGIKIIGKITHLENQELLKSGYYFKSDYEIKRSLFIDNILYTISDSKVKANSLTDLSLVFEIKL